MYNRLRALLFGGGVLFRWGLAAILARTVQIHAQGKVIRATKAYFQLDEQRIDYSDPECDAEFDREMIMTIKELFMFAVQISYGLVSLNDFYDQTFRNI